MTWRLEVTHHTTYAYAKPVASSYNEARMTPIDRPAPVDGQRPLSTISPRHRFVVTADYWGTQVTAFDICDPHDRLMLTSGAVVETEDSRPPLRQATWDQLADPTVCDENAEYLAATTCTSRCYKNSARPLRKPTAI